MSYFICHFSYVRGYAWLLVSLFVLYDGMLLRRVTWIHRPLTAPDLILPCFADALATSCNILTWGIHSPPHIPVFLLFLAEIDPPIMNAAQYIHPVHTHSYMHVSINIRQLIGDQETLTKKKALPKVLKQKKQHHAENNSSHPCTHHAPAAHLPNDRKQTNRQNHSIPQGGRSASRGGRSPNTTGGSL